MIYNLHNDLDRQRFAARAKQLWQRGTVVDLSEKVFRSPAQNRYLHLLIGAVAMETGVGLEFAKREYFKRLCNPALFVEIVEDKFAGRVETLKSSTELSKEQMSIAIDRFKRWAAEEGMYLPEPGDLERLKDIEIEMAKMQKWL